MSGRHAPLTIHRRLGHGIAHVAAGRQAQGNGELLAEHHGRRVHQVSPAALDHVAELGRLSLERVGEVAPGRKDRSLVVDEGERYRELRGVLMWGKTTP